MGVDLADIPLDGAAAYSWIDSQYIGGSASRDEDNFERIRSILRTGLVPAPQRSALLDALARIPGVSATENVANLDGVVGVAIGRSELMRFGERWEIIIEPSTGLVIGERSLKGTAFFGWGPSELISLTAIESSIVDVVP
jgi:RNA polymerase sigma-70 factor (ECF subfamily)